MSNPAPFSPRPTLPIREVAGLILLLAGFTGIVVVLFMYDVRLGLCGLSVGSMGAGAALGLGRGDVNA